MTISIKPDLHEAAIQRAKELNLQGGFSAYLVQLITTDAAKEIAANRKRMAEAALRRKDLDGK